MALFTVWKILVALALIALALKSCGVEISIQSRRLPCPFCHLFPPRPTTQKAQFCSSAQK